MKGLLKSDSLEAHEVGQNKRCRTRNASHAMHEDVGLLPGLINEVGGGFKVDTKIVVGVILTGNVKSKGDVLFGMLDVNILA